MTLLAALSAPLETHSHRTALPDAWAVVLNLAVAATFLDSIVSPGDCCLASDRLELHCVAAVDAAVDTAVDWMHDRSHIYPHRIFVREIYFSSSRVQDNYSHGHDISSCDLSLESLATSASSSPPCCGWLHGEVFP